MAKKPRPGRPFNEDPETVKKDQLVLRVTAEEKVLLQKRAEKAGFSALSKWIRKRLFDDPE